jgi:hypothetical protein
MSEFGCITNGRTFGEIESLYSTNMTSVFSGGLVYEYSEEGNGYGLVTISGTSVVTATDFPSLASAYSAATNPTGLGGATTSSASTTCPTESSEWEVSNDGLPAIPAVAEAYMSTGAGTGPGLSGAGSQEAGDAENESTGTATAGSGDVTETATSSVSATSSTGAAVRSVPKVDLSFLGVFGVVMLVGMIGGVAIL